MSCVVSSVFPSTSTDTSREAKPAPRVKRGLLLRSDIPNSFLQRLEHFQQSLSVRTSCCTISGRTSFNHGINQAITLPPILKTGPRPIYSALGLGVSVSTVCINNLECGVIGNIGKPLPELSLPLGQRLALREQRAFVKLVAKKECRGRVGKESLLVNL
jgi:hypothetical protein